MMTDKKFWDLCELSGLTVFDEAGVSHEESELPTISSVERNGMFYPNLSTWLMPVSYLLFSNRYLGYW